MAAPPLPDWVGRKPTLAIAFLDITVIELGSCRPVRSGPTYGVISPDRYGLMATPFELVKRTDRDAFLIGLASGFSWRELHSNPTKRSGWRFEEAYEAKSDEGDFTNKGKWCYSHGKGGWSEADVEEDLEVDIEKSLGSFATVTDEPFQRPAMVAFMAKGMKPLEVRLAPTDPFATVSARPYQALARELVKRLGATIPRRSATERAAVVRAHACPLDLEFPRGLPKSRR
jgi:hypothetical protein